MRRSVCMSVCVCVCVCEHALKSEVCACLCVLVCCSNIAKHARDGGLDTPRPRKDPLLDMRYSPPPEEGFGSRSYAHKIQKVAPKKKEPTAAEVTDAFSSTVSVFLQSLSFWHM